MSEVFSLRCPAVGLISVLTRLSHVESEHAGFVVFKEGWALVGAAGFRLSIRLPEGARMKGRAAVPLNDLLSVALSHSDGDILRLSAHGEGVVRIRSPRMDAFFETGDVAIGSWLWVQNALMVSLSGTGFCDALPKAAAFLGAADYSRLFLDGVHLDRSGECLVATSGQYLRVVNASIPEPLRGVTLPSHAVGVVNRSGPWKTFGVGVTSPVLGDDSPPRKVIGFEGEDCLFFCLDQWGDSFPKWREVVPEPGPDIVELTLDAGAALRAVAALINSGYRWFSVCHQAGVGLLASAVGEPMKQQVTVALGMTANGSRIEDIGGFDCSLFYRFARWCGEGDYLWWSPEIRQRGAEVLPWPLVCERADGMILLMPCEASSSRSVLPDMEPLTVFVVEEDDASSNVREAANLALMEARHG